MKFIIFCLIFFACTSVTTLSQLSAVYSLDNVSGNSTDCCIYLYKNGVYEIVLEEQETVDLISNSQISYGNYTCENKQINLFDLYNGYQMRFILRDDYIVSIRSFKWLLNRKFLKRDFQIYDDPDSTYLKEKKVEQRRKEFKQICNVEYPMKMGIYKTIYGFTLNIKCDRQYVFEYHGIILSEGTWSRNGNELVLVDTVLQYSFFVFIEKEGLNCLILPGNYNGFVYHKD